MNKFGLMEVRLHSKFDLRRLRKTVNYTALPRLTPPTSEELGYSDSGVTIFRSKGQDSKIATIVIRGATDKYMDDIE